MTSRKVEDLVPELQPLCQEFLDRCRADNVCAFLTCTFRSSEDQDKLYAIGRTIPGKKVTNAKGGQSKHNIRKAFDIAIKMPSGELNWDTSTREWKRAVEIGRALGLECGADWHGTLVDFPHFQAAE